jgi:argininosuccinate lyase
VKEGIPFRDAYKAVSETIKKASFSKTTISDYVHEGSIGNLCNKEIEKRFRDRLKCFKNEPAAEIVRKLMKAGGRPDA